MSDPATRLVDAEAAKTAWDRFVGPAVATIRTDYMAKLEEVAVQPMEGRPLAAVQALSLALRVLKEVEGQLNAIITGGETARADAARASAIARMSPETRRWAEMGGRSHA